MFTPQMRCLQLAMKLEFKPALCQAVQAPAIRATEGISRFAGFFFFERERNSRAYCNRKTDFVLIEKLIRLTSRSAVAKD